MTHKKEYSVRAPGPLQKNLFYSATNRTMCWTLNFFRLRSKGGGGQIVVALQINHVDNERGQREDQRTETWVPDDTAKELYRVASLGFSEWNGIGCCALEPVRFERLSKSP